MTIFCEAKDCEHNDNGSCVCGIVTIEQREAKDGEDAVKISVCGDYEVKE